jgi:hypothetical protein
MVTSSFSASTILPLTTVLTDVAVVMVPDSVKSPVSTVAILPRKMDQSAAFNVTAVCAAAAPGLVPPRKMLIMVSVVAKEKGTIYDS